MKRKLFFLSVFLAASRLSAGTLFVEAESFEKKGGWFIDQQFMSEMGSPYLLAHGMGRPVADAETTLAVPESGEYRVLVRTRNWVARWRPDAEAPGRFRVSVDGRPLSAELGAGKDGDWHWQEAGKVKLAAGRVRLALHDLTGFDGRCDALVLTDDVSFSPPDDVQALEQFRRAHKALTNAPAPVKTDLVVVGGGVAGVCAAISAARLGLSVALIHDRPVLGGNNSSEVRVHLGGRTNIGPYPRLGDVVNEIGPKAGGNAKPASQYEDERKLAAVRAERKIRLFLSTRVVAVEKQGGRIAAVLGRDIETGVETRFAAPLFADCTGDGTVGALAGAEYRYGREGRDETGEPLARETPDRITMGASVQWYSEAANEPVAFPDIPWALPFTDKTCERVKMGEWTWETGMAVDQVRDFERVRDYGMLVVYSNWNFLKNHAKGKADYANRYLGWVAYVSGKRESRRLIGDLVLGEQDVTGYNVYPDATCCTTWSIDLHYPDPRNTVHFPGQEFKSICKTKRIYPYPIPYRCFYSKNVGNLFMAGRHISVTHVVLGTTRVMRTTGMIGEVVGMAASICKKHACLPRAVYTDYLAELKVLMTQGVGTGVPQPPQGYNLGGTLKQPPVKKDTDKAR